jgi:hypothetical protein
MTTIIQQQNNLLGLTKHRIVQHMNDIDCIRNITTCSEEDMEAATITLRDIFCQYKDGDGGQLFDAIEKTNTGGTYINVFHERNIETIDNILSNLDATLDTFIAWDDCDVHFRYMTALPISVVGRVSKSTQAAFWENHLAAFKPNGIPADIDSQALQYITHKCVPWVRASYSSIAKGHTTARTTVPTIANTSAQGHDVNSTESGLQGGSNHTG